MKPWYESKTLWFNIFALLAVIIGTLTKWPELTEFYPQLTVALSIVNMILRFMTFEAISYGDKTEN